MTSGAFTTHYVVIPFTKWGEPIYLIPIGDIHRYAHNCAESQYLELLAWLKDKIAEEKNIYVIFMGDEDDLASASERRKLAEARFHSTTAQSIEDLARRRADDFAEEVSFLKGRIIGMLEGNHHYTLSSGMTSTQYICEKLGCQYLGFLSFIRLGFHHTVSTRKFSLDVFATHGKSAARSVGGSVTAVDKMDDIADADLYLMAHDHRKFVVPKSKLILSKPSPKGLIMCHRKILMVRTGSFQLGYMQGKENYASSSLLQPTDIGVVKIEMTPRFEKTYGRREYSHVDLHGSV